MKLIVGLGNPGKKYQNNRHNIGYMVIDEFAKVNSLSWRYNPDWIAYYTKSEDFVLLKPVAYMNKSGVSVLGASNFYKTGKKDILVIHDELDLPFSKIRLSFDSISAGHKGVDSVIESLGGVEFSRLRVGIGHPRNSKTSARDVEKYVLSDFSKEEAKKLKDMKKVGIKAIKSFFDEGIEATMNRFN
ncbi:aminoacyl-tRNA hydrolase [Candidatus Curtissbacteria bacterium RBG_13_35_7]|uniref:Peptidyl-tRNA hydrolase n=1 Tax=Candidatus Curtissbacteria bacterium RBG_13_35_7 TaxID=1797705 RepID=A0A1F5G378_9BACT|nr:MAG: aminoacyl-tRNA hydrolase [Candidatus Curtissbacteria bacterium RBG_13_35_7]